MGGNPPRAQRGTKNNAPRGRSSTRQEQPKTIREEQVQALPSALKKGDDEP